ncbi:hypothetical protein ACJ72_06659 [Emergomyces africanus]|uniref:Uncharacterized protein n=1 Tax=Emergomyces africanus TaxID=1955775 RepID=A0A1B7NQC1_9EURO|nr:hypothetical protein ACJ72_06659 [Emergomyces africanus]
MKSMIQERHDNITKTYLNILEPLLVIEENSALGHSYHTSATLEPDKHEFQFLSDNNEKFEKLQIYIPYLGMMKIEQHPVLSDTTQPAPMSSEY